MGDGDEPRAALLALFQVWSVPVDSALGGEGGELSSLLQV